MSKERENESKEFYTQLNGIDCNKERTIIYSMLSIIHSVFKLMKKNYESLSNNNFKIQRKVV